MSPANRYSVYVTIRKLLFTSSFTLLAGVMLSGSINAQPPDQPWADSSPESIAAARDWQALRDANLALETIDPQAAITRYRRFYEERGRVSGAASVAITSVIAQLYWQELRDGDKAQEIYRWGIGQFSWHPDSARLKRELQLLQNPRAIVEPLRLNSQINGTDAAVPAALPQGRPDVVPEPLKLPVLAVPQTLSLPSVRAGSAQVPIEVPSAIVLKAAPIEQPASLLPLSAEALQVMRANMPAADLPKLGASGTLARAAFAVQLQAAPGDAESLWQDSGLEAKDLSALLEKISPYDHSEGALRLALAGLLEHHGGELLEKPESLSRAVRVALADYYASAKDRRAEGIYRSVIAEGEKAGPGNRDTYELDQLASYYRDSGQPAKGAEVMERVELYTTIPSMVGNSWVEAARLYAQAGEAEKANALYRKTLETPSTWGWAKGLAINDMASLLIAQGQHEAARNLLSQKFEGQYEEQVNIANLALVARSYLLQGQLDKAYQAAATTIEASQAIPYLLKNEGLEEQIQMAKRVMRRSSQPLIVCPDVWNVFMDTEKQNKANLVTNFPFDSLSPAHIIVTVDNEKLQVGAIQRIKGASFHKNVYTSLIPISFPESTHNLTANLTLVDSRFPNRKKIIPLAIRTLESITLSKSELFFGETSIGHPVYTTFEVRSQKPIEIVVSSNKEELVVKQLNTESANTHLLQIELLPKNTAKVFEGVISIRVASDSQRHFELPCVGSVK